MTNKEILEAAQEILSQNEFPSRLFVRSGITGSERWVDLDTDTTIAVQTLEIAKDLIVFPNWEYEKLVD